MTLRKKVLTVFITLMVGILITGCSSSSNDNSNNTSDNDLPIKSEGNLVLYIKKSPSIKGQVTTQNIPAESTNIKLRIFNKNQEILKDVEIPDSGTVPVEVKLPIGMYELQAIAYTNSEALTMGALTGVEVKANEYTKANLTLERPSYNIETYVYDENGNKVDIDTIEGGKSFYISYTVDTNGLTFNAYDKLYTYLDGQENYNTLMNFNNETQLTAPSVETESTLSIKIEVVANKVIYGEYYHLYLPSSILNETQTELKVTPPEGGIEIGLN
ncbi:hypothetical protein SAMN06265827_12840 [Orenia metallireducens]|uniref:Uncharacterized protein n=1 Tax=Orenia metallireducens TaxID=1413210 RepID=A0A285I0I1_9FIRM|nr:hypothetical protein [Orenia metallireducens]SNY41383.1 hypothetical protein SAMN06265827_12840 [Orenia metallireducens]